MVRIFDALKNSIGKISQFGLLLSGLSMLGMALLASYGVIRRYILKSPEPYSSEISTILLVYCVMLAIAGVQNSHSNISVDFFSRKFSGFAKNICHNIITPAIALIYTIIIVTNSFKNVLYSMQMRETSQSSWEELLYPTKVIVPIGMLMLCMVLIIQIIGGIEKLTKK